MGFKLLIECSKDIDELHINFSDGTSVVTHSENENRTTHRQPKDEVLDFDEEEIGQQEEVVDRPFIPDKTDEISVADEIQNLEI